MRGQAELVHADNTTMAVVVCDALYLPQGQKQSFLRQNIAARLIDDQQRSLLHWVCVIQDAHVLIGPLIKIGADVSARDRDGLTPLHLACLVDNFEAAKILLEQGAKVGSIDQAYRTPLLCACAYSPEEAQENYSFLNAAAAPDPKGRFLNLKPVEPDKGGKTCDLLISSGANLNAKNSNCYTALHFASGNLDSDILQTVLLAKPDLDVQDRYGLFPLHQACNNATLASVKLLVQVGADIHKPSARGVAPAHQAVFNKDPSVLGWLLDQGVDPNAQDNHGRTLLHMANETANMAATFMLLEAGGDPHSMDKGRVSAYQHAVNFNDTQWTGAVDAWMASKAARQAIEDLILATPRRAP